LAALGPIAAALIALTLSSGAGARDASVLYVLPVLWESYFFGRRGTVLIVIWIGLIQVKRLEGEARLDELTGLLNRRGFVERAEIELGGSRRERSSVGVASFDLDHFKRINDECGHGAGDRVLVRMADVFRAEMRDTDVLARMGGEEFVALLPGGEIADAQRFAERARSSLAVVGGSGAPSVTVSAGITAAVAPSDLESILNRADRALYEAKLRGRDQIVAY
jgi:diguanylate cyclase (GGDEF)-like protein